MSSDKDCIEDLRFYPTMASQEILCRSQSVKGGKAELLYTYIDVEPVVFNRGFTDSAVGLVVDTLRDARRTVEDMRDLALGKSEMGQAGADTLRTMYPFLDDSRDRELLEQYRDQLKEAGHPFSVNDLVLKAVAKALRKHPEILVSLDGEAGGIAFGDTVLDFIRDHRGGEVDPAELRAVVEACYLQMIPLLSMTVEKLH